MVLVEIFGKKYIGIGASLKAAIHDSGVRPSAVLGPCFVDVYPVFYRAENVAGYVRFFDSHAAALSWLGNVGGGTVEPRTTPRPQKVDPNEIWQALRELGLVYD